MENMSAMSHLIQLTSKNGLKYWASIYYREGDEEHWELIWQGLRGNAQEFIDLNHAQEWLKEIESVQGHLTLEIIEI